MHKRRIFIGIPCYQDVSFQTLEDYMRFAFHLGRRCQDYDFFLGVKPKSEQFRARNSLVEAALNVGADYMLMLDDDHIIECEGLTGNSTGGTDAYNFLLKLIGHIENGRADIVGPVYYHRGGSVQPVVMQEGEGGGYRFLLDHELTGGLQEVAVQGGGCMLINMKVFDKIEHPWFEPEFEYGTDVQVCRKARKHGFVVCTDSSIEIGHVKTQRVIVNAKNKEMHRDNQANQITNNVMAGWETDSILHRFKYDAVKYLGLDSNNADRELRALHDNYAYRSIEAEKLYGLGTPEYYGSLGSEQLARQVLFHHGELERSFLSFIMQSVRDSKERVGVDFGCGAGLVGFELARRGHTVYFHDIDGAGAFEFLKWRVKKYGIEDRAIFNQWPENETADYCLFLDSIEHLQDWRTPLTNAMECLKYGGHIITNFIKNEDYDNVEHVFMDKGEFAKFMIDHKMAPMTSFIWTKRGRWDY